MLTVTNLKALLQSAGETAREAGQYIAQFERSLLAVNNKTQGSTKASQVVTQVDLACERIIFERLKPSCEQLNIAFLGEESAIEFAVDQHPRLTKHYFWCVDPLDGTLPFIEGVAGYAVSIALVNNAGESVLGVVYDPVTETLYQGIVPNTPMAIESQLLKNGQHWQPQLCADANSEQVLSLFFDRSFTQQTIYPKVLKQLNQRAATLGFSGVKVENQRGAVMNAIGALEQAPACYFKFPKTSQGGGSVWDFAATSAIVKAAGAWVSDIHGDRLMLNPIDTMFMHQKGIVYAANQDLAELVMATYQSLN